MTEYLITISSTSYRLLRATKRITSSDPQEARRRAVDFLAERRQQYIGGHDWDTWSLSLPGTGRFIAPIVARGNWQSD